VLVLVQRSRPLPYPSFLLVLIFLVLHSVAARWIYSFVPYDDWMSRPDHGRMASAVARGRRASGLGRTGAGRSTSLTGGIGSRGSWRR
jgi:hypothetical protein